MHLFSTDNEQCYFSGIVLGPPSRNKFNKKLRICVQLVIRIYELYIYFCDFNNFYNQDLSFHIKNYNKRIIWFIKVLFDFELFSNVKIFERKNNF